MVGRGKSPVILRLVDLDLARTLNLNALNVINWVIGLKLRRKEGGGGTPQSTSPLLRVALWSIQPHLLYLVYIDCWIFAGLRVVP